MPKHLANKNPLINLTSTTSSRLYDDLITRIKVSLSKGLLTAQKMLEYQRLKTYWEIGRDIRRSVGQAKGELRLSQELYRRISEDINKQLSLDLSADTICRAVQFSKNYPIFPKATTLTFTHYIALMRIKDNNTRARLEAKAINVCMTSLEIKDQANVFNSQYNHARKPAKSLLCQRGEPYVYCARQDTDINGNKCVRIDCGFKINIPLASSVLNQDKAPMTKNNRTIRTTKKDGQYNIALFKDGYSKLYTYLAKVLNVVDGDTIDVRIDVGFEIGLDDRLRLKGINTPELSAPAGRRAKEFLVKYFSQCPYIIIRTTKSEMYGRWLADIFALANCNDPYKIALEGEYVNQLLLNKGLAQIY